MRNNDIELRLMGSIKLIILRLFVFEGLDCQAGVLLRLQAAVSYYE